MSKPCINDCGRETNSKTGSCVICTLDAMPVEMEPGRPLEGFETLDEELWKGDEKIIQPPRTVSTPPSQGGELELKGRSKTMKKKCSKEGCNSNALKFGLCYGHVIEDYGRDALPPSMQKSAIQGGKSSMGASEQKKLKNIIEKPRKNNPTEHNPEKKDSGQARMTGSESSDGLVDVVLQIQQRAKKKMGEELDPLISQVRISISLIDSATETLKEEFNKLEAYLS